ncbi:MAG: ribosome biogenesis GTPase Der [bacterium]
MSTVVIVGRKNVGKSTIFNRLTGMRSNIVYKEPGVTRDRIYGEVQWCGRMFDIIDTGGFFANKKEELAVKINRQIEYGLAEADLVYFVVDAKSGLQPGDEDICQSVRKSNKPVFLLINKIDGKKFTDEVLEFAKLGFSISFQVSGEAGIGFGDVLDSTIKTLPQIRKKQIRKAIKVLILGRPNTGKSTLLNAVTKQERAIVDENPGTTRDIVRATFQYQESNIEIIDTCGLRRKTRIKESVEFYSTVRTMNIIGDIDIAILLFDASEGVVEQDRRIASMVLAKAKNMIFAPNKIDLIKTKDQTKILASTYQSFKPLDFVPVVPISAKEEKGLEQLLTCILDVNTEAHKFADKTVVTSLTKRLQKPTNGFLLSLKQINTGPPLFRATLSIKVKEHYIRYLRKSIRQYFGFIGVPVLIKTKVVRSRYSM